MSVQGLYSFNHYDLDYLSMLMFNIIYNNVGVAEILTKRSRVLLLFSTTQTLYEFHKEMPISLILPLFFVEITQSKQKRASVRYNALTFQNGIFLPIMVLTYYEKKLSQWSRKTFEIRGRMPIICKNFEINRTNYLSSERSGQFSVTECFF